MVLLQTGAAGALVDAAVLATAGFFLAINSATAALLLRALPELWRQWDPADEPELEPVLRSEALPTVSIVVTGSAEIGWTGASVRELLALRYPRYEVVLVLDGAASGDLEQLIVDFALYHVPPAVLVNVPTGPVRGYYRSRRHGKLFVIDKAQAGRADDLNAALNASRFPYLLVIDVCTRLRPDAVLRLMREFLVGHRIAAVRATARVRNGRWAIEEIRPGSSPRPRRVASIQMVETLRDRVYAPLGWNALGGQAVARDGVVLHRRDYLLELGGYQSGHVDAERDLDVRLRELLHAGGLSDAIPLIPDNVAWADARRRAGLHQEHRGQLEALRSHGTALFATRRGIARVLPAVHLFASVVLAPLMELLAYALLAILLLDRGLGDRSATVLLLAMNGYALMLSWWAVALERAAVGPRDGLRLSMSAVAEQLGYRQWVAWSRCRALWSELFGTTIRRARQGRADQAADAVVGADRAPLG